MTNTKKLNHVMLTETEVGKECNLNFRVEKEDLLYDIKFLMSEFYVATFNSDSSGLKVAFNNGQAFKLTVAEE